MTALVPGRQRMTLMASEEESLTCHSWRPVRSSQIRIVPSSPPLASQIPDGSMAKDRTRPS